MSFWCFISISQLRARGLGVWLAVYGAKFAIEIVASGFATFYFLVAMYYREPVLHSPAVPSRGFGNGIAVAYLCRDDLDVKALDSVTRFCARSDVDLLVHDDSTSQESRTHVNEFVDQLSSKYRKDIRVLRRSICAGGKPGAVNHIIKHLGSGIDYLLLCDSDSYLVGVDILDHALPLLKDPLVGLVQFRNIGYLDTTDSSSYRILANSVDFYDIFVSFMDRYGWSAFLGHNALIRLSACREVGGFSAGQFADDIDFSIKLRLAGYSVRYARSAVCGERHPVSYPALRRRTAKWAYGCTQIFLKWTTSILISRRLSFFEKTSFFLTVGYYHFQALLLLYLGIFYLLLPFESSGAVGAESLLTSAGLILLLTFLPSITYFIQRGKISDWPKTAACWGFTYGSQDFVVLRAITRCLLRRGMFWIPTNTADAPPGPFPFLYEVSFGVLIVAVAALKHPVLLVLPTTALFAGKFLVTPWLDLWMFRRHGAQFAGKVVCS